MEIWHMKLKVNIEPYTFVTLFQTNMHHVTLEWPPMIHWLNLWPPGLSRALFDPYYEDTNTHCSLICISEGFIVCHVYPVLLNGMLGHNLLLYTQTRTHSRTHARTHACTHAQLMCKCIIKPMFAHRQHIHIHKQTEAVWWCIIPIQTVQVKCNDGTVRHR